MTLKSSQRKTREARKEVYKPVNPFVLPQELVDHFAASGHELRFVRVILEGKEDHKNIREKFQKGYSFVTMKELPLDSFDYVSTFDSRDVGKYSGVVIVGDLALCKINKSRLDAIFEYKEDLALTQKSTFSGSDQRMNKMAPVEDTSNRKTVLGSTKRALNFGEDEGE